MTQNDNYFQGPGAQALTEAQVDIGVLKTQVTHLTAMVDRLQDSNKELQEKMDLVLTALSEARGGWRALMLLGGAGAALGSGVAWALAHVRWQV